jgi:hypothetical protein
MKGVSNLQIHGLPFKPGAKTLRINLTSVRNSKNANKTEEESMRERMIRKSD